MRKVAGEKSVNLSQAHGDGRAAERPEEKNVGEKNGKDTGNAASVSG